MQKIFLRDKLLEYKEFIDDKVIQYVEQGQIHTFESYEDFDLMAFEWYDIYDNGSETSQILLYLDREDFFIICEDERVLKKVEEYFKECESNEKALYLFFSGLVNNDMDFLEQLEDKISATENEQMQHQKGKYLNQIIAYRKELLRLKRYYEQVDDIIDNLRTNDNDLLEEDGVRHLTVVANRTERFRSFVLNLRDYVTQMRESYQSEIDIEQNNLMRIFTVITAVFLPLTLMVGWYGMNFQFMPELSYRYGYVIFIVVSILISIFLLIVFKKKKWF